MHKAIPKLIFACPTVTTHRPNWSKFSVCFQHIYYPSLPLCKLYSTYRQGAQLRQHSIPWVGHTALRYLPHLQQRTSHDNTLMMKPTALIKSAFTFAVLHFSKIFFLFLHFKISQLFIVFLIFSTWRGDSCGELKPKLDYNWIHF